MVLLKARENISIKTDRRESRSTKSTWLFPTQEIET